MEWDNILIATIAAFPPTVTAWAALRKASKTDKKVSTENGNTVGQLVERNTARLEGISENARAYYSTMEARFDRLESKFDNHILDTWIHRQ